MNRRNHLVTAAVAVTAWAALATAGWSMPNFARKYGAECAMCHTTIPRLNEYGFNFRKAGFRPPDEIGKEGTKTEIKDTIAARVQGRLDVRHHDDAGATTNTTQLTLHEVTLYPLSSSFGKHYGSLMELSILGEDFVEIENAYFRYAGGREKSFFSARAGIFHPFEGYGASDRPYSINRPLIQTVAANQNGSTYFTPWNFDEAGVEATYVYNRSSLSATVFNGLVVRSDEGAFKAFPAAGGELQKAARFTSTNSKDFQLFANHMLKDDGSGVSAYYYHGKIDLPLPGITADEFNAASSFGNSFDRFALYASYRVLPQLELQGAYQIGQDHYFDTDVAATGTFKSKGFFAEADVPWSDRLTFGGRYDWFDPSDLKGSNDRNRITVFTNTPLNDGLQFIAEYQHVAQKRAAAADLKDDNFQVRLIWIW
jgi:hypothetical protein